MFSIRFTSSCQKSFLLGFYVLMTLAVAAQENPNDPSSTPGLLNGGDAVPGKSAGRSITLSDFGAEDLGYLAISSTPPTVGVVLVPDAYGLDEFTKKEAERLAGEGYLAVAVDIYNGKQINDPGQIANMVQNLDDATVMKTIDAGVRLFHESPKFHVDQVVMVGWGTGANYAWKAAYGKNPPDGLILLYGPVQGGAVMKYPVPVCALYSDRDPTLTRDAVLTFQHALRDAGSDFTAWFIAAAPGWSNPQSKAYNPVEDREAWKVADPFILKIAAQPQKKKGENPVNKAVDSVKDLFKKL